jgi:ribonuclease BN (tRNA processing enzyme)
MKLILLGTGGYYPNDLRHTPAMLLPECGVMLDAGTATYRAGAYLELSRLDVFLTHAHLDHVVGLTYLFNVIRTHPLDEIVVHGRPDKLAAVDEHLFAEPLFPIRPPIELRPLEAEVAVGCQGRVTHFALEHPGSSVGYRVDWPGRSMAYVTDTTARPGADYVERIRGVDLLLHECYFADTESQWAARTGHSCTTPTAQVARAAGVGRLVLVHHNPMATEPDPIGLETARVIFPNTVLGEDLMELEF